MLAHGCCLCGLDIEALIETAHIPNRAVAPTETARLCILCHRAYDLGLMNDEEIKAARDRWLVDGLPAYSPTDLQALWRTRKANWQNLHRDAQKRGGATLRRSARARRAWRTRRKTPAAQRPGDPPA